jgi:hypothetical protein
MKAPTNQIIIDPINKKTIRSHIIPASGPI